MPTTTNREDTTVNDTSTTHDTAPQDDSASPQAGSRPTGDQRRVLRRAVAQRCATGASIRTIAGEVGRSYSLVYRLLQEANVKRRSRRGRLDLDNAVDLETDADLAPSTP
ncbi:helix-turn-helix domain-containing protein [Actinoplanes sp. NPDC051411]|uniref:helix-turn-helix domain-containing protein n=1 Tax=Actinoplanes sp. NPDC051411 TaxID=3155522 RepID=UPI003425024E